MCRRIGKERPSERNQSQTLRADPSSVNFAKTVRRVLDDGFVRMETHFAIRFSPHEAHGQASAQFAAGRFIADSPFESGAQDVQFCFRHDALQPEHQAIVKKRRMIDAVAIADQRVGHAAEIEQAIPVGIIAGQAGDFQSEHDAHAAESDFRGEACEAGALGPSGTGKAQVFVDDGHLFLSPAQLARFLDQSILASGGLAVVFDLGRAGLANVDDRGALRVVGFDFARIIHGFSPPPGFVRAAWAMSRARIWIATAWCSSGRVSQASVSSRRRSKRFRFVSRKGALLRGRGVAVLAGCWSEAAEESVDHGAGVEQVFEGAEGCRRRRREGLCRRGQIGPIGRDQRFTAVRQDEEEQPRLTLAMQGPQNAERLGLRTDGGIGQR